MMPLGLSLPRKGKREILVELSGQAFCPAAAGIPPGHVASLSVAPPPGLRPALRDRCHEVGQSSIRGSRQFLLLVTIRR